MNTLTDRQMLNIRTVLTPDECARILRVDRRTIYRWCEAGELESVRIRGRLRIRTDYIRKLLGESGEK
ncbi:MAG: hypothetical protein APR55_08185 [Methanolinea sp. SDB]|nr:MAG: hypothetical protein APR55_08185 [Methanolinea sp. SDB]